MCKKTCKEKFLQFFFFLLLLLAGVQSNVSNMSITGLREVTRYYGGSLIRL